MSTCLGAVALALGSAHGRVADEDSLGPVASIVGGTHSCARCG